MDRREVIFNTLPRPTSTSSRAAQPWTSSEALEGVRREQNQLAVLVLVVNSFKWPWDSLNICAYSLFNRQEELFHFLGLYFYDLISTRRVSRSILPEYVKIRQEE